MLQLEDFESFFSDINENIQKNEQAKEQKKQLKIIPC